MKLIAPALSVYGSAYNPDYASLCNVKVPPNSNWCGLFIGAMLAELECELPSNPQVARSYLKVGKPIDQPKIGDIVVFWRVSPNDWRGHVSIFIREDESGIYCLGGNQQGKVKIVKYYKSRLLGYRRLSYLKNC